jgi:hypothetical protein
MEKLPLFLKRFFWEADFKGLNPAADKQFIIARILEYGDKKAIIWLRKNFTDNEIKKVVCRSRSISVKSAIFWQTLLGLKKNTVLCLKKSFQEKRSPIWRF